MSNMIFSCHANANTVDDPALFGKSEAWQQILTDYVENGAKKVKENVWRL